MIKNFRMSRKVFAWPYILFMLLFIVTPLVMVLVNAFLADGKLTLDNFVDFFFGQKQSGRAGSQPYRGICDHPALSAARIPHSVHSEQNGKRKNTRAALYPAHVGKLSDSHARHQVHF